MYEANVRGRPDIVDTHPVGTLPNIDHPSTHDHLRTFWDLTCECPIWRGVLLPREAFWKRSHLSEHEQYRETGMQAQERGELTCFPVRQTFELSGRRISGET